MTNSVLYEAPGPVARRRSMLASAGVGVLLLAVTVDSISRRGREASGRA